MVSRFNDALDRVDSLLGDARATGAGTSEDR